MSQPFRHIRDTSQIAKIVVVALIACCWAETAFAQADETTNAAARKLMLCLNDYQRATPRRIPPADFERMLATACVQEKHDFRVAGSVYLFHVGVRDGTLAMAKVDGQVNALERMTVGAYTKSFYGSRK